MRIQFFLRTVAAGSGGTRHLDLMAALPTAAAGTPLMGRSRPGLAVEVTATARAASAAVGATRTMAGLVAAAVLPTLGGAPLPASAATRVRRRGSTNFSMGRAPAAPGRGWAAPSSISAAP